MKMTSLLSGLTLVSLVTVMSGCATTDTTTTTWGDPAYGGYGYARPGVVTTVQEVVQRTRGNPAGGAVVGALIGGALLGHNAPSALIGAAGGAAVGAATSQGSSESRTYNVVVRFDDGAYATFPYAGYSPFQPGQRVVLTAQGLGPG